MCNSWKTFEVLDRRTYFLDEIGGRNTNAEDVSTEVLDGNGKHIFENCFGKTILIKKWQETWVNYILLLGGK